MCLQNMSDAMAVLPKLSTGLDVNVRFTGVTDFEYTPECIVFDLLDIPLYHGWLVDPQVTPYLYSNALVCFKVKLCICLNSNKITNNKSSNINLYIC